MKARISLINVGIEDEKLLELKKLCQEGISIDYPEFPTGLAFVTSFLKQNGLEIKLFDFALCQWLKGIESGKELLTSLVEFSPDLIVLYLKGQGYNLKKVTEIVSTVNYVNRKNFSEFILMSYAGGVNTFGVLYKIGKYISVITYGEIEPFMEFIAKNLAKKAPCKISKIIKMAPNIGYCAKRNGSIIINPLVYSDLNKLPLPDFSIIDTEEYLKINNYIPIALSRGCPYRCWHCPTRKIFGDKWHGFDIPKVKELLEAIKTFISDKRTTVALTDNNLVYDLNWFRKICQMFNESNILWDCRLRPDWITEEIAESLAYNNCVKVILSGDVLYDYEPSLTTLLRKKPITLDCLKKASVICQKAGLEVGIYFIVDFYKNPETTLPEIVKECNVNSISLSCFHNYDGFDNFDVSSIISPVMKEVIAVFKKTDIKINVCTNWGETHW